ncbi:hypothetical protein MKK88_10035 [Methylobacterium sp. E-005]|uniref:hypothetical protein n=1 Tax=Methylobacterium sp. E-005 TaxID=2836549 RepID=UPI001FB92F91|nr:hypothetical protein [Methylobacterium sp. E-005]MCJ2086330.1 hypothetical protein [Methylobacterium sp. E-005]
MTRSALARLPDVVLDQQIVASLREAASEWPSVGAMVTALSESRSPAERALATQVEAFLMDWRQPPRTVAR